MSGALWFFFWPESAWNGGGGAPSASIEAALSFPSRGGGHYIPLSDDFWLMREQHMRRANLPGPGPYTEMVWLDWLRDKLRAQKSAEAALRLSLDMDDDPIPPIF